MTETIEYEQFDQGAQPPAPAGVEADLSRVSDIPMELSVEIGRTHMTVGETLDLRVGALVSLERSSGEPVDLLVNGTPIARGEVVVIDEQYGLRVTEILDTRPQADHDGSQASSADPPQDAAGADTRDGSTPAEG